MGLMHQVTVCDGSRVCTVHCPTLVQPERVLKHKSVEQELSLSRS